MEWETFFFTSVNFFFFLTVLLAVKKVDAGEKVSFEFSECTVQLASSHSLRVAIIYRPETDSEDHKIPTSKFFTEFCDYLETIVLGKEQLVIVGDFNIHVDVPEDSDTKKLIDLLESFSLQQHGDVPTHVMATRWTC